MIRYDVVADSSPLIALCRIGALIEAQGQGIVIHPAAIARELREIAGFRVFDELTDHLP